MALTPLGFLFTLYLCSFTLNPGHWLFSSGSRPPEGHLAVANCLHTLRGSPPNRPWVNMLQLALRWSVGRSAHLPA